MCLTVKGEKGTCAATVHAYLFPNGVHTGTSTYADHGTQSLTSVGTTIGLSHFGQFWNIPHEF